MRRFIKYLPVLALFGTVAGLRADTTPTPAPATAPSDPTADAKALSPGEMNIRASAMMAASQDDLRHVMFMKEHAKNLKDVIKLNCVNDKLVKLKAQLNIQENTHQDLQHALDKGGDDRAAIYVRLSNVSSDIKQLRQDAQSCVGEPEIYKQESGVVVTHPDFPDDPTQEPPQLEGTVEPPGYASPFH